MSKSRSFPFAAAWAVCASMASLAASAACTDPWVTHAVRQVTGRDARGAGNAGECNIQLYGNGHWSNYNDLVGKVKIAFQPAVAPPLAARLPAPNLLVPGNGGGIIAAGGGNLSGQKNGAGLIAAGGGNVVSSGSTAFKAATVISPNGSNLKP